MHASNMKKGRFTYEKSTSPVYCHTSTYLIVQLARAKQAAVVEALETHAPEIVLFRIVGE